MLLHITKAKRDLRSFRRIVGVFHPEAFCLLHDLYTLVQACAPKQMHLTSHFASRRPPTPPSLQMQSRAR